MSEAGQEELATLRAAVRGLLARVEDLEARLGVDVERADKALLEQFRAAYRAAGHSGKSAKNLAWAARKRGLSLAEVVAGARRPSEPAAFQSFTEEE